jgi:hypothetical protein
MMRNIDDVKDLLAPVALILSGSAVVVLLVGILTKGHYWGDDFASYIMQARSLVESSPQAFVAVNRPIVEQSSYLLGPVAYPWGFPVLLALLYAVFGLNIMALKLVGVLSFLLFLLVLWFGFRESHSPLWLWGLFGLFAFNPTLLEFVNHIQSDVPFLLVSTFSVLLMGQLVVNRRRLTTQVFDPILLGASLAAATFIRTNGILLLPTLMVSQTIAMLGHRSKGNANGRNKSALLLALLPYVAFLAFYGAWESYFPEGGASHWGHLATMTPGILADNLFYYAKESALFFVGVPFYRLVYVATLPFLLVGLLRRYRTDYHLLVYVGLTFLLLILWPERQGLRFLFPVLPFYLSLTLTGLETVVKGRSPLSWSSVVFLAPVFIVVVFFIISAGRIAYENMAHGREPVDGPFTPTAVAMFQFVAQNTAVESTVIFFKPRAMALLTGRHALMINEPAELDRGDYICLFHGDGDDIAGQVSAEDFQQFAETRTVQLVFENAEFTLYKVTD